VLTTGTFEVAPVDDPCELPPTGGYRGLENQLYRVEIHNPGQPGAGATFKWSRENASVGSRVASIISGTELELQSVGRDDVLRFNIGDRVEITDDIREFAQVRGEMRRITGIEETTRRIQLDSPLTDTTPGAPNLRVRRWDQKGKIFRTSDQSGTPVVVQDLDAAGTGVIDVPADDTTKLILENGVNHPGRDRPGQDHRRQDLSRTRRLSAQGADQDRRGVRAAARRPRADRPGGTAGQPRRAGAWDPGRRFVLRDAHGLRSRHGSGSPDRSRKPDLRALPATRLPISAHSVFRPALPPASS
jgi:Family of unknown function (DUF6519)